ncbi:2-polyprenyl-3-methyl-5-hydroxy-6-metoxy-1,4-benzoquinol methylase [Paraburkholderia sp. GAS448]
MVSDDFYRALEDRFRGSRDLIKARQGVYLPFVEALGAKVSKKMLDVGCGRGEWLELLAERGIAAEGLDFNEDFVKAGIDAGLSVFKADAMEFLKNQPDQTYSLITAFHVVEHLGFNSLLEFLKEAHRVVDDGGAVLLETPNPANLIVGACNFYIDPTHERPIPSVLLSFAAEYSGFESVVVVPVNRSFLQNNLEFMPGQLMGAKVINKIVSALDQNLMQAPDYAIIAIKKQDADLSRIAESLVSTSPLAVSADEEEDVNSLLSRIVEAEKEAVIWREKAAQADAAARDTAVRAQELQVRLTEAHAEEMRQARIQELEARVREAQARAAAIEDLANRSQQQIQAMLNSRSWRLTAPIRAGGNALRWAGISRTGVRRVAKPVFLHAAAYMRSRPALQRRIANLFAKYPGLRARLVNFAGPDAFRGVANVRPADVIESVDQLTARGRSVYDDLQQAKKH